LAETVLHFQPENAEEWKEETASFGAGVTEGGEGDGFAALEEGEEVRPRKGEDVVVYIEKFRDAGEWGVSVSF